MVVSVENKYIFIAVPKTGTTAIENFLLKYDKTARRGGVRISDEFFKLKGHATANEALKSLKNHINNFQVIGFVRYPYSRLVSSYYFYKKGGKKDRYTKNRIKKYLHWFQINLARILPFWLWIYIYPYKSNIEYFVDDKNEIIVDFIGLYENLNSDLEYFFSKVNPDLKFEDLPHLNKSFGPKHSSLFNNRFITSALKWRHPLLQKDLHFYESVSAGVIKKGTILN